MLLWLSLVAGSRIMGFLAAAKLGLVQISLCSWLAKGVGPAAVALPQFTIGCLLFGYSLSLISLDRA